MIVERTDPPPPVKPDYSGQIRALEPPRGTVFFPNASAGSIQSIVSRISKQTGWQYVTEQRTEGDVAGIRVWRTQ